MKVRELLEAIQDIDPEMNVYVEADHGQDVENAFDAGVVDITVEDGHEIKVIHPDDLDEYEISDIEQVFLISGE